MNLNDSLTASLEQLWVAAVTVSALKYIAGLVNKEWSGVSIKTETKSSITLHDQDTPDKTKHSIETENIINTLAAEITIDTEVNLEQEDKTEEEITTDNFVSSLVSHCVQSPELPEEEDPHLISSLTCHCVTNDSCETEDFLTSQLLDQYLVTTQHDSQVYLYLARADLAEILTETEQVNEDCNMDLTTTPEHALETNENELHISQESPMAQIQSNFQYFEQPIRLENDFISSMVTHQLPIISTPEEFPSHISSLSCHTCLKLEEDCSESLTTLISHFTDSFYDSGINEDVNEETNDLTEDATEYTEIEHLETILEVSEICDMTIDESEITEDIEDFSITIDIQNTDFDNSKQMNEETDLPIFITETDAQSSEEEQAEEYDAPQTPSIPTVNETNVPACVIEEMEDLNNSSTFVTEVEDDYDTIHETENVVHILPVDYFFPYYIVHQGSSLVLEEIVLEHHTTIFKQMDVTEENIEMFKIEEFHSFYPIVEVVQTRYHYEQPLVSMVSHQICSPGLFEDFQEVEQISSMQTHVLPNMAEPKHDSQLPQIENNDCLNEQLEEESFAAADNEIENEEPVIKSYKLQLTRIQQLQKLVEDELEEFDTQRKCKVSLEQATETQVVNIVKGIEFITNIKFTQDQENIHSKNKPEVEDLDIIPEDEFEDTNELEEKNYEIFSEEEEVSQSNDNLIHASCTLNFDSVSITSNYINDATNEEPEDFEVNPGEHESNEEHVNDLCQPIQDITTNTKENDLKLHPTVPPRKHVNMRDKIREETLSDPEPDTSHRLQDIPSNDNNEDIKDKTIQFTEGSDKTNTSHETDADEKKVKPSILKNSKTNVVKVATATLNENVKKQSYRIKFKIKLNESSPKKQTSVLRYLFGCFGGEKLFNSQQK